MYKGNARNMYQYPLFLFDPSAMGEYFTLDESLLKYSQTIMLASTVLQLLLTIFMVVNHITEKAFNNIPHSMWDGDRMGPFERHEILITLYWNYFVDFLLIGPIVRDLFTVIMLARKTQRFHILAKEDETILNSSLSRFKSESPDYYVSLVRDASEAFVTQLSSSAHPRNFGYQIVYYIWIGIY